MKIALIGATGFVGSALLKELLARGHEVRALLRDPAKLAPQPGLELPSGRCHPGRGRGYGGARRGRGAERLQPRLGPPGAV